MLSTPLKLTASMLFLAILFSGCTIALGSPGRQSTVTIQIPIRFSVMGTSGSEGSARLLLNDAKDVVVTVTNSAGKRVFQASQGINSAATETQILSFAISVEAEKVYTIVAESRAPDGTALFRAQKTMLLTASQTLALTLVPASYETLAPNAASSKSALSNTSQSYFVPFEKYPSVLDFGHSSLTAGLPVYFQSEDGTYLGAVDSANPRKVIRTSAASDFGTGVFVTVLNKTASTAPFVLRALDHFVDVVEGLAASVSTTFVDAARDSAGNTFVIGTVLGGGNIIIGGTGYNVPAMSEIPVLVKYDPNGNLAWVVIPSLVSGTGNTGAHYNDVAVDSSGNVVVVGQLQENSVLRFNGFDLTANIPAAGNQAFALSFTSSGTSRWSIEQTDSGNSPDGNDFTGVAIDTNGNSYITGASWSAGKTVEFNHDTAHQVTTGGQYAHSPLLLKVNASGGIVKLISNETGGSNYLGHLQFNNIAFGPGGKLYVLGMCGYTDGPGASYNYSFAGSSGSVTVASSGGSYVSTVVMSFDTDLNALWGWGSASNNWFYLDSVTVGVTGKLFVAGTMRGTATYSVGSPTYSVSGSYSGGDNGVVLEVDPANGNILSNKKTFSNPGGNEYYTKLTPDGLGNIYLGGWVESLGQYLLPDGQVLQGTVSAVPAPLLASFRESDGGWNWVQTQSSGPGSKVRGLASDGKGHMVAVGTVGLNGGFAFHSGWSQPVNYGAGSFILEFTK